MTSKLENNSVASACAAVNAFKQELAKTNPSAANSIQCQQIAVQGRGPSETPRALMTFQNDQFVVEGPPSSGIKEGAITFDRSHFDGQKLTIGALYCGGWEAPQIFKSK